MSDQLLSTDPKAGLAPDAGPSRVALDARGKPIVSSDTSDSPIGAWFETHLRPALESAAHPQTYDDVMHLLMSPVDAERSIGLSAVNAALEKLKPAAKATVAAVKSAAQRIQVHPSAVLDVKLNQPLAWLKDAVDVKPATAPAPAPTPAPPAAAPPAASTAAPAQSPRATGGPPVPDPNPVIQKIVVAMKDAGQMSDSEAQQAYQWIAKGVEPKVVWQRIQDARALQKTGPFAKLPSKAEVDAAVTDRNARGRWPEE